MSSDYGALAGTARTQLTFDTDSALLELTLGYCPNDATIYREIMISSPGAIHSISPHGEIATDTRRLSYGDQAARLTLGQKMEFLDSKYESITSKLLDVSSTGSVLSLSAGYDSRYILANLVKQGVTPTLCTFGNRASEEIAGAQEVAAKCGRQTELLLAGSHRVRSVDAHDRTAREYRNRPMVRLVGLVDAFPEGPLALRAHRIAGRCALRKAPSG